MKETYTKPVTELEEFKTIDVITTSGDLRPDDNIVRPWD